MPRRPLQVPWTAPSRRQSRQPVHGDISVSRRQSQGTSHCPLVATALLVGNATFLWQLLDELLGQRLEGRTQWVVFGGRLKVVFGRLDRHPLLNHGVEPVHVASKRADALIRKGNKQVLFPR